MQATAPWPALADAVHARVPRLPFRIDDAGTPRLAGSVARAHLPALARWADALRIDEAGVTLGLPAAQRQAFFAEANAALHAQGLIVAWRNETYPVLALPADGRSPDAQADLLATFERAASRFWGTATFGAHCNGYVTDTGMADGRPAQLWIARRSDSKPTDPGLLDNLVGGGVPHGQTPAQTVLREGWEEAGLTPMQMAGLAPGRILRLARDIPEGFQLEWLSVYDLALPPDLLPQNQDGEVQALHCWPVAEALARAAAGEMTTDATLATLDFALRHGLLTGPDAARCAALLDRLAHGHAQRLTD
ncbi:NUDIX hydrolase [Aquabacterium sp. OR-4]|uniref:NUDIX hydrolase n=1 Tax=Aquabacterium sp. OR-4 TaxID=2978127 RepID=UPI0021B4CB84|nr:NUDIX domain-containing protein [Aquabacterium sp. OR-4]MDT7837741.1 NUDIX domain-containing protein [Aquabacterium sp. OR-4]